MYVKTINETSWSDPKPKASQNAWLQMTRIDLHAFGPILWTTTINAFLDGLITVTVRWEWTHRTNIVLFSGLELTQPPELKRLFCFVHVVCKFYIAGESAQLLAAYGPFGKSKYNNSKYKCWTTTTTIVAVDLSNVCKIDPPNQRILFMCCIFLHWFTLLTCCLHNVASNNWIKNKLTINWSIIPIYVDDNDRNKTNNITTAPIVDSFYALGIVVFDFEI